jgi:hypothetical protein
MVVLFFGWLVKLSSVEALEVQARVAACTTQSGKGIGYEQRCQGAW